MKDLRELDAYRLRGEIVREQYGWDGDETCGAFSIKSPTDNSPLVIVASTEGAWDHVSVSHRRRVPNWAEMEFIKRAFFKSDETAMQLHVPATDHISFHPFCLHLWRPQGVAIPRPPAIFVGPPTAPWPAPALNPFVQGCPAPVSARHRRQ